MISDIVSLVPADGMVRSAEMESAEIQIGSGAKIDLTTLRCLPQLWGERARAERQRRREISDVHTLSLAAERSLASF